MPSTPTLVRLGLALFVLAWIFGPYSLRAAIPIWLPFLVALGLELNFFVGGLRASPPSSGDRGPQEADRDRYGYGDEAEELLLVREGGEEVWVPYSGETGEELDELIAEAREAPEEEPPPPAEARRPFRGLALGLAVIAALALVFWFAETRTGWNGLDRDVRTEAEARFSAEASRLAEKRVEIRCDEAGEFVGAVQHADGVAVVAGDRAYLTPDRCFDLYRLEFKGEIRDNRTARALGVLAHETWHLRGVSDEGITECYALQSGVDLGRRFGLSIDTARRLMRQRLVESTQRGRTNAPYRLPPDCRDGGGLDLRPGSSEFP